MDLQMMHCKRIRFTFNQVFIVSASIISICSLKHQNIDNQPKPFKSKLGIEKTIFMNIATHTVKIISSILNTMKSFTKSTMAMSAVTPTLAADRSWVPHQ